MLARAPKPEAHDPRLHLGPGKGESADAVLVRWPDGTRSVRRNVRARQFLRVMKGS